MAFGGSGLLAAVGFCWLLAFGSFWLLVAFGFWRLLAFGGFWLLAASGFWRVLAFGGFWLLAAFGLWWLLAFGGFWRLAGVGFWWLLEHVSDSSFDHLSNHLAMLPGHDCCRGHLDQQKHIVNFPCCWYLVYSRVLSMVHSAAIWVYRALELTRAYACVKMPLDVAVGTNFILVAEQVRVRPTASSNP